MTNATMFGVRIPDPDLLGRLNETDGMVGTIGTQVCGGRFWLVRVLDDGTAVHLTGYTTAEQVDWIVTDMIETGWR